MTAASSTPGGRPIWVRYRDAVARASGGIGRRAGFRFLCPKGCGGSSPPSPTHPPTQPTTTNQPRPAGPGDVEPLAYGSVTGRGATAGFTDEKQLVAPAVVSLRTTVPEAPTDAGVALKDGTTGAVTLGHSDDCPAASPASE